jgi:hypothetical protein
MSTVEVRVRNGQTVSENVPDQNPVLLVEIEVLGHRDRPGPVLVNLSTILHIFQTVEKYVYKWKSARLHLYPRHERDENKDNYLDKKVDYQWISSLIIWLVRFLFFRLGIRISCFCQGSASFSTAPIQDSSSSIKPTKYIYSIPRAPLVGIGTPTPYPASECGPPWTKGGPHSPAGEGWGVPIRPIRTTGEIA